ncbi:MAG: glycosyltransferase [Chryseobacterium sp.]|uniref:glycosyltransferase n=1 Tax=Chryseobacterium sp. TaxID=1871047 RepID=UPI0025BABF01|nr:glycosyltransferase [Chryseobacterium sp.]MCJ7933012.1 glycosyltransferase [Chryseobacterium sp.]
MNILFLEAVQVHGGARKSTVELAERLKKQNHNVHIVDFWGNCTEFVDDVTQRNINLKILLNRNNPIIINSSKNPLVILKNIVDFYVQRKEMQKNLEKYITTNKIELIIVNNSKTLSILKKSESYKIIYFARGWFNLNSIPKLKRYIFKSKAEYFIGVSESTRQAIFSGGFSKPENIYVVHNAIDIDKIESYKVNNPVTKNNKLTILHCGGYLKEKGQLLTIELAKKLKAAEVDFEIIIVGAIYDHLDSQEFYKKINELIDQNNLGNNIKLVTDSNDPYKYFNETDIVIHPSYTEGLPRVVMEALAFKKPVIANAVGELLTLFCIISQVIYQTLML